LGAKARFSHSWLYLTAWYAISLALQLSLAFSQFWKFGVQWWQLPPAQWFPGLCLALAFTASAIVAAALPNVSRGRLLLLTLACTIAIYGLVFLGLVVTRPDYSRTITLGMFASALVTIPFSHLVTTPGSARLLAFCALIGLAYVGSATMDRAHESILEASRRLAAPKTPALIRTAYYNLDAEAFPGPNSQVHGGALGRIGDGYLLLTGDGHLYTFDLNTRTNSPDFVRLPYRVPINGDEFAAAAGRPWTTAPLSAEGEYNASGRPVLNPEMFRAYGLLVQEIGTNVRIFASHVYWKAAEECWVERVSMLESDRAALLSATASVGWKTLYETTPCLPIHGEHRHRGLPFAGHFGGGRMALLDRQTLLLTVGDFGFDGVSSDAVLPQDPATSYGKTLAINIADGRAIHFTLGHRNPQGLYIDSSGTVWSTEHGPQGGDELNRLVGGANYGWPYATYGTQYGAFSWPLNKSEQEQQGYEAPLFAWVPSIAVSNLLRIERGLFPRWRGDLLIGSIKARTLFRALVRNDRVAYVEPIPIGSRIRDLIEGHDGRIILWTDEDTLVSLRPKGGKTGEGLFAEKCSGCHLSVALSVNTIGPNLSGIVGRRVASQGYSDYSPSLRRLGGVWTEARLDAFLKEPTEVCPGTAMDFGGVANDAERASIIDYLKTL
jgi:aldose sugar dehydrogenase